MENAVLEKEVNVVSDGNTDDARVNRLYTRLSVAKKEIWKRWEDDGLKE